MYVLLACKFAAFGSWHGIPECALRLDSFLVWMVIWRERYSLATYVNLSG
jgi:hypothetical protein